MAKITDTIDADTAQLLAEELGHTVRRVAESDVEEGLFDVADDPATLRAAAAGRDHHGPRRPRQDLAARRHPPDQRGERRSRRHHPAYRRLSGDLAEGRQDHLHRHARPRRLHGDARARRQGDRPRHSGGRGRRRRDAADRRGDQSRQGRQGADDRRDQQDRQGGRQARARAHRAAAIRSAGRIARRRRARRRGVGDQEDSISTSCSKPSRCRPKFSTSRPIRSAPPKAP